MKRTKQEDIQRITEAYGNIRRQCWLFMQTNPQETLGSDSWLRNAILIDEVEITYNAGDTHIDCGGHTYSSQTQDTEWFEFRVPIEEIKR